MGYTRSFKNSIQVTGSVHASYPASKNGGSHTVHYQQTVPVTINIHVDTDPLDNSVQGARSSVDLLTGAVVAMNGAQCAVIKDNSKKISERMTAGFYKLINSDLSVKKTEHYNEIQSRFALLAVISKDLRGKYERMNSDLARLQSHYAEIFQGIDRDLQKRIKALDHAAFALSDAVRTDVIGTPLKEEASLGMEQFGELKQSVELITLAHIRKRLSRILNTMSKAAEDAEQYASNIQSALYPESCDREKPEYIPVVFCHTVSPQQQEMQMYTSNLEKKESVLAAVRNYLKGKMESTWRTAPQEEVDAIEKEFFVLMGRDVKKSVAEGVKEQEHRDRVYQEMMKMWKADRDCLKNV